MKPNSQCTPEEYARRRARWLLKDAIRYGKMERGTACEFEGGDCDGPIQAHHDDYSKPYEVRWICRLHHARVDAYKHLTPRTISEARIPKDNGKTFNMSKPNPRYDRPKVTT